MPEVEVPSRYRGPTQGVSHVQVEGQTVRECIEAVDAQYPGFQEQIIHSRGELNLFVRVFVNGDALDRSALEASVEADDKIQILTSAAGG